MNSNSTNISSVFSLRIVSIDSYMKAPLFGLDPCYSYFRADEVKQVPVIRIFGTDLNGTKTCAHVHGVFPYLYIPYASEDGCGESNRLAYQIASSLDKAINISLGQANSSTQHVFKIILVKARPFYGYHQTEHKFLKIYLYNPAFIRRVANLLQNGAILGKIYQPHESHVPYILQFMIDYNLYGMSMLHVPATLVCYRQKTCDLNDEFSINGDIEIDDDILQRVDESQILDRKIKRMSTSKQEIDIRAAVILNGFQIPMNGEENEHANPGIAFLWSDERERRKKMDGTPPPLVVTQESTQDRCTLRLTESEIFHQTALNTRLEQIRSHSPMTQSSDSSYMLNQTINRSNTTRKFNLDQFLQNSVYPAEWSINEHNTTSEQSILDASIQIDHLQTSKGVKSNHVWDNVQFDPNETFVDEEIVLNLTQKASNQTILNETLNENEHEVLNIFEVLEEDELKPDEMSRIDDDSALAPLSQQNKDKFQFSQSKCLNNSTYITSFEEQDSDDDLLNEFSMSVLDCLADEHDIRDECSKETDDIGLKIPQLDGTSDSPKKRSMLRKGTIKPNIRSPQKSAKKYTPLDIVITRSPNVQIDTQSLGYNHLNLKIPRLCIEKCDANTLTLSKTNSVSTMVSKFPPDSTKPIISKNETENKPMKSSDKQYQEEEYLINTEVPEKYREILKKSLVVNLIRYENIEEAFHSNQLREKSKTYLPDKNYDQTSDTGTSPELERRYPKRNRAIRSNKNNDYSCTIKTKKPQKLKEKNEDDMNKMDFWYSWYTWSNCKLAENYDKKRNFFPQPGPSHLNYYEDEDLIGYYQPFKNTNSKTKTQPQSNAKKNAQIKTPERRTSRKIKLRKISKTKEKSPEVIEKSTLSEDSDWEDDIQVQSFYEQSFVQNAHTPTAITRPISDEGQLNDQDCDINLNPNKPNSNTTISTPALTKLMKDFKKSSNESNIRKRRKLNGLYAIKPHENTPCTNDVERDLESHKIPRIIHPVPYYSDPNDISVDNSKKEIGSTVLQLSGNAVNNCENFSSELNVMSMAQWQKVIALQSKRSSRRVHDNKSLDDSNSIRKLLASSKAINISIKAAKEPPSNETVTEWLNMRAKTFQKKHTSKRHQTITKHVDDGTNMMIIGEEKVTKTSNRIDKEKDDDVKKAFTTQCDELLAKFRSRSDFTISIVSNHAAKNIHNSQNMNALQDEDDVICLDDLPSAKSQNLNAFKKLSESELDKRIDNSDRRVHLNLEDTIVKLNSMETSFGIKGGPMDNSFGFRFNLENFQCAKASIEHNYLTILFLEIHCSTRLGLLPDPAHDEIICIFYEIHNDVPKQNGTGLSQEASGVFINTNKCPDLSNSRMAIQTPATYVDSEIDLFMELVRLIRRWDPDIFAGYEIELTSWGYVIQRSQAINVDLVPLISRIPSQRVAKFKQPDDENIQQDAFLGFEYDSEYKLHGRILLDVWRLLRGEIALTSYSFENIMYHVMHRRCPLYSQEKLTSLWNESVNRWIVIEYYVNRVKGTLEILNQLDLIGRTCELAKLFGIQFYEVLSRGSQFRVESMMLRIAKPKNLVPISPSVQQRAHMRAPEYLPLILEPHSRFYSDPLIVLDFQSLYPSMIIAYNYCFSTCLGRVEHLGQSQPFELGAWQLRVPRRLIEKLNSKKLINISPCGAVFVKQSIFEGVLPRLLREILDTRLMVKQSMKLYKSDKLLQRILHSRQLGLKLMANVTYGYTAANFSGRMPCVEVGDSVVSKGRETLERAIRTVEMNKEWGCRVVYGDTDSMFVLAPGRSREDAFRIGSEIADTVTKQNPFPVRLKLEKVYHPSILQTKKRYVGYMYESSDQMEATYEAKGIETVRRDGCPAVAKILEKTLRILFETCDVSAVKRYVCKQFTKILEGRANIQDLIFAKEFRGVNGYKPGACVPALELTRAALQIDRRAEPRKGERVPYLVINGPPGVPLIRLVRSPHEYLTNEALKINAIYYINKVIIPPINRCLLLIGVDANQWFADLPRKSQYILSLDIASNILDKNQLWNSSSNKSLIRGVAGVTTGMAATKKSTISQYFSSTHCVCDCGEHTQNGICSKCLEPQRMLQSAIILSDKCMQLERKLNLCLQLCSSCCGQLVDNKCMSLDCSVLFMLNRCKRDSKQIQFYRQLLCKHF